MRTLAEIEAAAVDQLENVADDQPTRVLIREAHALGRREGAAEMRTQALESLMGWTCTGTLIPACTCVACDATRAYARAVAALPLPDDAKETR